MSADDKIYAEQEPARSGRDVASVPLRQAAYDQIEAYLNEGELRPGQVVSQRELVERTGLTLGAIREAIPRLEAEGLLQTIPKRGLMVPSLDVSFVREAYQMRIIIELAAFPAALRAIPKQTIMDWIAQHEAAAERLSQKEDIQAAVEFQKLDWALHDAIVAALGNSLIENVYRVTAIKTRMAVQRHIKVTPANATRVIREHLVFLTAMRDGREEEALAGLKTHITHSQTLALGGSL
jgi:DNA-binding GntR family transcriptional regulator